MTNRRVYLRVTTLSAAIAGAFLGAAASGQTYNCGGGSGGLSCNTSGTSGQAVIFQAGNYNPVPPMNVSASADITVTVGSSTKAALQALSIGGNGNPDGTLTGTDTQGLTVINTGNLTLQSAGGPIVSDGNLYGLFAQMQGGNAASSSNGDYGGNGGVAGRSQTEILSVTNHGDVTINLPNVTVAGGAAVAALSQGGAGSGTTDDHNPSGAGGQSAGASIVNTGNINVNLAGTGRYAGVLASSRGGNGADQYDGGANMGGGGGSASVTNSGNVALNWVWTNNSTASSALYGVLAQSTSGNGGDSTDKGLGNGGAAGIGAASDLSAKVTLLSGGNVTVTQSGTPPAPGAGVAAIIVAGNGGNGLADEDDTLGGNGGNAGSINGSQVPLQINATDASVSTAGSQLPALLVSARGGAGGGNFNSGSYHDRNGGLGGQAGDAGVWVTTASAPITLSTIGDHASGIQTSQVGGAGGAGGDYGGDALGFGSSNAGNGGSGGNAGSLTVKLAGSKALPITITTAANDSHGVYAVLQGGQGADGGTLTGTIGGGSGGDGGAGGSTGSMNVSLTGTSISTRGANAFGILVQNLGNDGGTAASATGTDVQGGNGGNGGSTGTVTISTDSNTAVSTQGQGSPGILAQTASGAGANGGNGNGQLSGVDGSGGNGGSAGAISVANAGTITTTGTDSVGIMAQSLAGAGGAGSVDYGIFYSKGGTGGAAGSAGVITVTNTGAIRTSGTMAMGVLAQSIGGSGGAAGSAGGLGVSLGGDATTNPFESNANTVTFNASGTIATTGLSAIGVLAQSIGGGGGAGGATQGLISVGGTGGKGGSGGSVIGTPTNLALTTGGDNAHGLVAQSIGGGGGNGGNASSFGIFHSVAVGASGGDGGTGGSVVLNLNNSNIVTQGTKAAGLVGQSIGGGGGTGGQAFAYSVGPLATVAVAVGGQGGTGGNSGVVSSQILGGSIKTGQTSRLVNGTCADPCLTANAQPIDSFGAVIQSIGGGGGLGGNATAKAAAIGIPVTEAGTQVSIPVSVAVGGTGGIAGDGNYVTFAAAQGAQIETRGQGSHGVLIQSIGGGGGAGGDSSSLAAALDYGGTVPEGALSLSLNVAVAVGADGGAGGNGNSVWSALGGLVNVSGGQATFTPDAAGTASSTIATYGDYANGITAQSIGGGGGNAGFGSANTQDFGTGSVLTASIGLGGSGAGGGNGGLVQVEVLPTGQIQTAGSGAMGVLAQSIGGGGGTSQGSSYNFVGLAKHVSPSVDVKVGKTGGAGGAGGAVGVTVGGNIATYGGDAAGVQAQSIGGGGGQGGSAGSDGSADNPIVSILDGRVDAKDVLQDVYQKLLKEKPPNYQLNLNLDVSVGGAGGAGNTGGAVTVNLDPTGTITTAGDWSAGIFAQSIGGGGGKGGGALATGSAWADPTKADLTANYSVGGDGGKGSTGGTVTTALNGGSIATSGYGAAGIYAQSVGGGGGHAADGSDGFFGTLAVGIGYGGSGGGAGNGGSVTLSTAAGAPANITTIGTQGEAAFGTVLQSVGGGGGFAGAGTSIRVALADGPIPAIKLSSGQAQNTSEGNGGAVTLQDNGALRITTQGNNAFGVLAQSVGGGGGIVGNSQNQQLTAGINTSIFGSAPQAGAQADGGTVTASLGAQSWIKTFGTGSHGLVAQSVGGGGGLVGLPGTSPTLTVDASQAGTLTSGTGQGGNIRVTNNGVIAVTGAGAIGILAQSVSGAGGLKLAADGNTVFAGSGSSGYLSDATVDVTVGANAIVSSTAVNGIGIFAQNANGNGVTLTIDGSVAGGSATAAGTAIWTDSAAGSMMTIASTGSVTADTAVRATTGLININNAGLLMGNVYQNGGGMTNTGTFSSGAEYVGTSLQNNGLVALGGREGTYWGYDRTRFIATTFNTTYTQSAQGTLKVGADFDKMASDFLSINGPVTLDGKLLVAPLALLPNRELAVLNVNGVQTGALTASDSPVVDYEARQGGGTTHVRAVSANFNADSMQLKRNATNLASHLQRDWDQGGSAELAKLYAVLDAGSRQGAGSYQNRLSDLSPGVALAPAAQMQLGMARFTGAMMSCPTFVADGPMTKEQDCVWGQVTGRNTNQDGGNGSSGFSLDSVTYQLGGQRQIAPDWYLGGSFAYQNSHLRGDDHRVSGSGNTGYAGLVLKREAGPWMISGALGAGYGSYDLNRNLAIPNFKSQATAKPDVYSFGARIRVARTFTEHNVYVKPYVDLDATYSRMSGYEESGDALHLKVAGSDQMIFGLAPTLEIGGRSKLTRGAMLRPFAYAGVSLLSEDGWKTKSKIAGASNGVASFATTMPTDNVVGRIGAGLQVTHANKLDFRLQYDGEFASRGNSHSGSLKAAYRF
ncbi:autotransporter outer membrane beta-barrel domain-containing protein [Achromobacter marplatensis]|uniref:autotransporter outer membrane beta-barrel domain-containing protein n=1 Tax=Achromobacter marplatensis TaxID=470868 RepID=UPI0028EFF7FF|nr:autotransporter outer membrane beta-barrel domain-containing protein [Achromobacter marplatensis]